MSIASLLRELVLRTPAVQALGGAALAHTGLSFLYLVALLHLPSFFRFDVLVTIHLYDLL